MTGSAGAGGLPHNTTNFAKKIPLDIYPSGFLIGFVSIFHVLIRIILHIILHNEGVSVSSFF